MNLKRSKILKALRPDETLPDFKAFDDQVNQLKANLKEKVQIKTLDDVKRELEKFKSRISLDPLLEAVKNIEESLAERNLELSEQIEEKTTELESLIASKTSNEQTTILRFDIRDLQTQLSSLEVVRKEDVVKLREDLSYITTLEDKTNESLTELSFRIDELESEEPQEIKDWSDTIEKLRKELYSHVSNVRGGNANRQIRVEGVDVLTKYTDINLIGGGGSPITAAVNSAKQRVDITFPAGGGGSTTLLTTTMIWVDGNRVDSYTASGTIQYPYKTIGAAMTAITVLGTAFVLHIAPGTYVENVTVSAFPAVIYGNGSTIVGNVSLSKQFDIYDLNIIGNVTQSDVSTTVAHAFESSYIQGNLTLNGLCFLYTMATDTSGTMTINAGTICVVDNSQILDRIVNSGTLYFNASNIVRTDNVNYLIDSTASGSLVYISNSKFVNNGTGGGLNLSNNATTSPNEVSSVDVVVGGTTNGITCGGANCILSDYNIFGSGGQFYATGTALSPTARSGGIILAGNTSGRVIVAPASVAGSWTMTLPVNAGSSGNVLITDGNGITSWSASGGSGITRVASIVSISSTFGAVSKTDYAAFANVGVALTLPTAVGNTNLYTVKNVSTSSVAVLTTGGQLIDGSANAILQPQYVSIDLLSDNANWNVI